MAYDCSRGGKSVIIDLVNRGFITTVSPTIYIMLGVPGSGRTYTAKYLAEATGGIHLQSDEYRSLLYGPDQRAQANDPVLSSLMINLMDKYMGLGYSIILDADNNRRSVRQGLRALARQKKYEIVTIWVQTDADTAFSRASARDRRNSEDKFALNLTEAEFDEALEKFQSPQYEKFAVVSGRHVAKTQLHAIRKKLFNLQLLKQPQRTAQTASSKPQVPRNIHARRRLSL